MRRILPSLTLFILLSAAVFGYGVTAPYWDDNPLHLEPGESTEFSLILQNMVGGEEVALRATLTGGGEIASLVDEDPTYIIPFGTKNTLVPVSVSIPVDTPLDTEYKIAFFFRELTPGGDGMLEMATGVNKQVRVVVAKKQEPAPVEVVEESAEEGMGFAIPLMLLLVVVILGILFYRKKK